MNMFSNVFYDPNSPWYYIVGVVFLILIFGALALYVILSKKYAKKSDNGGETDDVVANSEEWPVESGEVQTDEQASVETQPNGATKNTEK